MKRFGKHLGAMLLCLAGAADAQDRLRDDFVDKTRDAASGYAIGLDLMTNALTRSCAAYGGDAYERTRDARAGWRRRNSYWVDIAHRYLSLVQSRIAANQGIEAGRRFYDERKAELQRESQAFLERSFPKDADAFDTCRKLAADFNANKFDVSANVEHTNELRALAMELPRQAK